MEILRGTQLSSADRDAAFQAHLESVARQRARFWRRYAPAVAGLGLGLAVLIASLSWWLAGALSLVLPLLVGGMFTMLIALLFVLSGHYPVPMTRGAFDSALVFDATLRTSLVKAGQHDVPAEPGAMKFDPNA